MAGRKKKNSEQNRPSSVYRAEQKAQKQLQHLLQRFDTLEACQAYVNHITASPLWAQFGGQSDVPVKAMRRIGRRRWRLQSKSLGLTNYQKDPETGRMAFSHISLAPKELGIEGGWDNFTILHELAHVVNPYREKHGARFLAAHLQLIYFALGAEAERIFRLAYEDTLDYEQRGFWFF